MMDDEGFKLPDETRKRLHPDVAGWIEGYAEMAPDVQEGDEVPEDVADSMVSLFDLHAKHAAGNLGERWLFAGRTEGHHVRITVRCGTPGSRALLGSLLMTREEAAEFRRVVERAGAAIEEWK
ncbi:MAG: hypothetical protein LC118_20615 [Dehalococcoidia bacterium]|nr:hypothetical protein [Dehalococcoidia bacterium]